MKARIVEQLTTETEQYLISMALIKMVEILGVEVIHNGTKA